MTFGDTTFKEASNREENTEVEREEEENERAFVSKNSKRHYTKTWTEEEEEEASPEIYDRSISTRVESWHIILGILIVVDLFLYVMQTQN